jgi:hypothetical protein
VSLYKPWTRGLVRAHPRHMSLPQICRLGFCTHFVTMLCLRLALSRILKQHSNSAHSLNSRETVSPQKGITRVSLLEVDQAPLLPPKRCLNSNPGSYQSNERGSQVGSQAFLGSFVWWKLTSSDYRERGSLLWHLAGVALLAGWGC